jgi:hypothetical protein
MRIKLLVVFLCFTSFGKTQTDNNDQLRLGLVYSPHWIKQSGPILPDFETRYCQSIGISGSVGISKHFRAECNALYTLRNYAVLNVILGQNIDPQTGQIDTTFELNYSSRFIEIPILFSYNFRPSKNFGFSLILGFSQQISLGQKTTWSAIPASGKRIDDYSTYKYSNNLNATGIQAGIGLSYRLNERFIIGLDSFFRNYFTKKTEYLNDKAISVYGVAAKLMVGFK